MISTQYRRWMIYFLSCLLFTFSQFYRSSIAVISTDLAEELILDAEDLGLISACFFYAFAVMQIPIGLYLDSVGPRLLMTILSFGAGLGAIIFAYGESATMLIIGRLFLGVGMACNLMGPLKLITSWFSSKYFASLSAILVSVATIGNIMATTPLVWVTGILGWRRAFLLFAIINFVIVALFYLVVKDNPEDKPYKPESKVDLIRFKGVLRGVLKLFGLRDYYLISIGTFFRYGIYASVQALWAGPFLMITLGLSAFMTGNLLLVMSIGMIIGSPICGFLSDSILRSRKHVVTTGLMIMAGVLIALSTMNIATGKLMLFALFFCFGFSSGTGQIMYAHIKERMPHQYAGTAMTGINFFTMAGVAFFLHGLGYAIKNIYPEGALPPEAFRTAFVVFGCCLFFAALLYSFTGDNK